MQVVTPGVKITSIQEETDDALLSLYARWRETAEEIANNLHWLEEEMLRRMHERHANGIPSDTWEVKLEQKATYDQAAFRPLLEVFTEGDVAEVYTPPHQETREVPAAWATVKLIAKAKRYGAQALQVVEAARVPGRESVSVKRRG